MQRKWQGIWKTLRIPRSLLAPASRSVPDGCSPTRGPLGRNPPDVPPRNRHPSPRSDPGTHRAGPVSCTGGLAGSLTGPWCQHGSCTSVERRKNPGGARAKDQEADRDLVYRQCGPGRQRLSVRESNLGLRRQGGRFPAARTASAGAALVARPRLPTGGRSCAPSGGPLGEIACAVAAGGGSPAGSNIRPRGLTTALLPGVSRLSTSSARRPLPPSGDLPCGRLHGFPS
jgi:hypothetical protein